MSKFIRKRKLPNCSESMHIRSSLSDSLASFLSLRWAYIVAADRIAFMHPWADPLKTSRCRLIDACNRMEASQIPKGIRIKAAPFLHIFKRIFSSRHKARFKASNSQIPLLTSFSDNCKVKSGQACYPLILVQVLKGV